MLNPFGCALLGATGLVLGPVIAALFPAVLHTWSNTFRNVLAPSSCRARSR